MSHLDTDESNLKFDGKLHSSEIEQRQPPWYKQIPTMISLVAILFSFTTTYFSMKRSNEQDIQSIRSDLRQILLRISEINRDSKISELNYSANKDVNFYMSSMYNAENMILSRMADDDISRLPEGRVFSSDYIAVAMSVWTAHNYDRAAVLLQQALKVANGFDDEVAALRAVGNLKMLLDQKIEGRQAFGSALDVFGKYRGIDRVTVESTHLYTEILWAEAEIGYGYSSEAQQHIDRAQTHLDLIARLPYAADWKDRLLKLRAEVTSRNANFTPAATPPGVLAPVPR